MELANSVIVSLALSPDGNPKYATMIVGKKNPNESITIINAIQGEEAIELFKRLTIAGKKED